MRMPGAHVEGTTLLRLASFTDASGTRARVFAVVTITFFILTVHVPFGSAGILGPASNVMGVAHSQGAPRPPPIRLFYIAMPRRAPYLERVLADLLASAPDEFSVQAVPPVMSFDDERVAEWSKAYATGSHLDSSNREHARAYGLAAVAHVVAMGMIVAENSSVPSIVIEDDVVFHRDFARVVPALLRNPNLVTDALVQFGWLLRYAVTSPGDMLAPGAPLACIHVDGLGRAGSAILPPASGSCLPSAGSSTYSLGHSAESSPWGLQAYAASVGHAAKIWASRASPTTKKDSLFGSFWESERNILRQDRPLRVVPPLAIAYYGRFPSMISSVHDGIGGNQFTWSIYATILNISEFNQPILASDPCRGAPSAGSLVIGSKCVSLPGSRWEARVLTAKGDATNTGHLRVQIYLTGQPQLCMTEVSSRIELRVSRAHSLFRRRSL